jgi:hypothetical protein
MLGVKSGDPFVEESLRVFGNVEDVMLRKISLHQAVGAYRYIHVCCTVWSVGSHEIIACSRHGSQLGLE